MSFGKEKRLLLGILALVAPLPLPFDEVLEWPLLGLYLFFVGALLRRALLDPPGWLPNWAMNLLGLAYLPVLYLDLTVFFGGQLVRPVVHLAMFAVVVKLFALRRERDKWHVMAGVFFLFLTSMATSVHPTIMLYLVLMVGLSLLVLTKFSYFSVLARFGYHEAELAPVPLKVFLGLSTVASLLVAVPLFAVLPRIQTPYILARGVGTGTIIHASGFSDIVTLDSIGTIRESRQVVLRMRLEAPERLGEIRLKAATYDRYDGTRWRRSRDAGQLRPRRGGVFQFSEERTVTSAEIWLLPLRSTVLPLPVETTSVVLPTTGLGRDRGGALSLPVPPSALISYEVRLAAEPVLTLATDPRRDDLGEPSLDLSGVTPRMERLAAEVMGTGPVLQQAQRLEVFLSTQFEYTTELVGRVGEGPLETFLFDSRRGHCEYFASSMVLLLRSQDVPARLVTGFLGAESNPLERYLIVRQSNAHAWVEANLPGLGWTLFDPTPASGRPVSLRGGWSLLMSQVYDYVLFRWDRYVLTFGFYDQMQLFQKLRRAWRGLWSFFGQTRDAAVPEPPEDAVTELELATEPAQVGTDWQSWARRGSFFVLLFVAVVGAWLWWWTRRIPSATEAYLRLRARAQHAGVDVGEATGPLAMEETVARSFPAAAEPAATLVSLYLRESFGGATLDESEHDDARSCLRAIDEALKKAG